MKDIHAVTMWDDQSHYAAGREISPTPRKRERLTVTFSSSRADFIYREIREIVLGKPLLCCRCIAFPVPPQKCLRVHLCFDWFKYLRLGSVVTSRWNRFYAELGTLRLHMSSAGLEHTHSGQSVFTCVCPPICMSVCLPATLSVCLSRRSVGLSVCMSGPAR